MTIFKATITMTLLFEAGSLEQADSHVGSCENVEAWIDEGDAVGAWTARDLKEVPDGELEAELLALGNDGFFFKTGDEDEV